MSIQISILPDAKALGEAAGRAFGEIINQSIRTKGYARIILATGASQFETIDTLLKQDVDWSKVEMFHLDEYVDLPESHPASFRKYLKERFCNKVNLKAAHFVNGEGDVAANIAELTRELRKDTIDVALVGIGENGHIAFNDPPADFETDEAYKVVDLDDKCKMQQVGEGWFATIDDVPKQAITMCVKQILAAEHIITATPHAVKADAVKRTFSQKIDPTIPASILKTHGNWQVFLDPNSAKEWLAL